MLQYDEISRRLALPSGKRFPDPNNNNNCLKTMGSTTQKMSLRGDKYSLRPRSSRRDDTDSENNPKQNNVQSLQIKSRSSKPKQKPAPLSKYRRKTANARERSRMREINTAFEALRRAVPHMFVTQCPGMGPTAPATSEKLTKITTLRLAMRYIDALSSALNTSGGSSSSSSSNGCLQQDPTMDLDAFLMESSDAESLCTLSDNSFTLSDQPLTPADFTDNPLSDTVAYFGDQGLSLDFTDPSLSPDFSEHSLSPFDPFLPHFS